ncbi:hypothetical protein F2P79_011482 [Pimephales promelas]|nr:hypothetical protein F2P79_011482 [Pimephales promelas]
MKELIRQVDACCSSLFASLVPEVGGCDLQDVTEESRRRILIGIAGLSNKLRSRTVAPSAVHRDTAVLWPSTLNNMPHMTQTKRS